MKQLRTLSQSFEFPGATQDDLARVLAEAPLVGDASIFGDRTVRAVSSEGDVRRAVGFQPLPVPLLRFDFAFSQSRAADSTHVIVEFTQPQRRRPYLAGQFVWLLRDGVLQEEINTAAAMDIVDRPLGGQPFSLRRYLFFTGGHARLMREVAANIRSLLEP